MKAFLSPETLNSVGDSISYNGVNHLEMTPEGAHVKDNEVKMSCSPDDSCRIQTHMGN